MILLDGEQADELRVPLRMELGGLMHGACALEVLPIVAGEPWLWHRHRRRLAQTCGRLGFGAPADGLLEEDLRRLVANGREQRVRVVTGPAFRCVHGEAITLGKGIPEVSAIAVQGRATALPGAKTTSYGANVAMLHRARSEGADTAIALHGDEVLEGATCNVLVLAEGRLRTPSRTRPLLLGLTVERVFELAEGMGIACEEGPLEYDDLCDADAVLLSSSVTGLRRVCALDGRVFAPMSSRVGRRVESLHALLVQDQNAGHGELDYIRFAGAANLASTRKRAWQDVGLMGRAKGTSLMLRATPRPGGAARLAEVAAGLENEGYRVEARWSACAAGSSSG